MSAEKFILTLDGLSFGARALVMATYALMIETQNEEVEIAAVKLALNISDEAFEELFAEGREACVIYRAGWGVWDRVHLMVAEDVLMRALGAAGRPNAKAWADLRVRVFARHEPECAYCSKSDCELVLDHVVPVSRGGSNHPANLLPACVDCNSTKGGKPWQEWCEILNARHREGCGGQ